MTFVSVAQATNCLGIDAKTLHRWLADAQLPLHRHPHDGRKKGLSSEHLERLARLHQRRLAPLSPESPAPGSGPSPELSARLLGLPEQLATLQAQITALQQQVADLTGLLTPHEPAPAIPQAPSRPSRTLKPPPKSPSPAPRARHAASQAGACHPARPVQRAGALCGDLSQKGSAAV